jgi:predicted ATP-grasp superfamily ATP-dependent carboligase
MSSIFPHTKGKQKRIARLKIVDAIKNTENKVGEMLSLPAGKAVMEKLIHKDIKTIRFNMCEHSKPIFAQLANTVCNYFAKKPKLHLCKIGDLIYNAKENQYLHLVLDYCGAVSTFEEEIKVAFEKNVVKVGGVISLTLSKRGCLPEFVQKTTNLSGRKFFEKEAATRTFLDTQAKDNYIKEVDYMYGDKNPMMLYIYRRVK